jgi:long-subunit fatty acid transport protein
VLADGTPTGSWICKSSLPLPSSVAIGVAYTPAPQWNLAFDIVFIDYSRITKELHAPYAYPGGDVVVVQQKSDFEAEAVTEYHFGLEYLVNIKQQPVALRAGYYFDPAHDIKYRGEDSTSKLIYTGGEDVHHLTAGIGVPLADNMQFDMAADLADDDSYRVAVSFAFRY